MEDAIRADLVHGARLFGVDECGRGVDGERLIHGGELQSNAQAGGERRTDRNRFRKRTEPLLLNFDSVCAVGKLPDLKLALVVGFELRPILSGLAGNLNQYLD